MVIGCFIRYLGYYLILKERVGLGLQHTTFRGYFICEDRGQDNNLKAVLVGLIPLTRYCHWRMSVTKLIDVKHFWKHFSSHYSSVFNLSLRGRSQFEELYVPDQLVLLFRSVLRSNPQKSSSLLKCERVVCYVFITQLRFDSNPQKFRI